MATFYVSGVWKDGAGVITHLYVHPVNNNQFSTGVKKREAEVITSIGQNNVYYTMRWNYQTASWVNGAKIDVVIERGTGRAYLRTVADAQVIDNLDNMINMVGFV